MSARGPLSDEEKKSVNEINDLLSKISSELKKVPASIKRHIATEVSQEHGPLDAEKRKKVLEMQKNELSLIDKKFSTFAEVIDVAQKTFNEDLKTEVKKGSRVAWALGGLLNSMNAIVSDSGFNNLLTGNNGPIIDNVTGYKEARKNAHKLLSGIMKTFYEHNEKHIPKSDDSATKKRKP